MRKSLLLATTCIVAAMANEELMRSYQAAVDAHRAHDLPAALTSYRRVIALQPGIAAVHNNVAAILLAQGDKAGAEASWRTAVSLKADYAEAQYNLAVLLSEKGDEYLGEAKQYCELALRHREAYSSAHHLLGNILSSQGQPDAAARHYAEAEAIASGRAPTNGPAASSASAASASSSAAQSAFRWDGVEVGHSRRLELPDGASWTMTTLSLTPLVFRVDGFLSEAECERIIQLAEPKLQGSLVMGDARAAERTSRSVFLGAAEDGLLHELQRRLAALVQLPLAEVQRSEDLQVVHYGRGDTFGMHHDSSAFHPRFLTAFYYLNEVRRGGETAFPAANGAMAPDEAMALKEPASDASGLVVAPVRGSALLFYNHDGEGALDPTAVHAGCRVLEGEKWGANHWVRLGPSPQEPARADGAGGDGETDQSASAAGKNAAKNRKKRDKAKQKRDAEKASAGGLEEPPAGALPGSARDEL